jgi:hypothetical protein
MATVKSTQRTNATAVPVVMNAASADSGRVRVKVGEYEASSLASGDVIDLFKLPNKARILAGTLAHDALGSSTTLSVGYKAHKDADGTDVAASAAAYKAAAASTSAQIVDIVATLALGNNSVINADSDEMVVTATMGGAAGTGTIVVRMFYAID